MTLSANSACFIGRLSVSCFMFHRRVVYLRPYWRCKDWVAFSDSLTENRVRKESFFDIVYYNTLYNCIMQMQNYALYKNWIQLIENKYYKSNSQVVDDWYEGRMLSIQLWQLIWFAQPRTNFFQMYRLYWHLKFDIL